MLQRVNFNPLRPRGRRLLIFHMAVAVLSFQPTPPTRTETGSHANHSLNPKISTHSAHEDGDVKTEITINITKKFQPTPPTRTETFMN